MCKINIDIWNELTYNLYMLVLFNVYFLNFYFFLDDRIWYDFGILAVSDCFLKFIDCIIFATNSNLS